MQYESNAIPIRGSGSERHVSPVVAEPRMVGWEIDEARQPGRHDCRALVLAQVVLPATQSRTYTSPRGLVGTPAARPRASLKKATNRPSGVITGVAMVPVNGVPLPVAPGLMSQVVCVIRSRTKTSMMPFVSPVTRLVAVLMNATHVPSGVITGSKDSPLPNPPSVATLTSRVVPVIRSRTKMSLTPFVSPATRSLASLSNTTKRPLAETWPHRESPLPPPVPLALALTRTVVFHERSRRKRFTTDRLLPPGTRSLAALEKTTNRPLGVRLGATESRLPPAGSCTAGFRMEMDCTDAAAATETILPSTSRTTGTVRRWKFKRDPERRAPSRRVRLVRAETVLGAPIQRLMTPAPFRTVTGVADFVVFIIEKR